MAVVTTTFQLRREYRYTWHRAFELSALSAAVSACGIWLLFFLNDDALGVVVGTVFAVFAPLTALRWLEAYWKGWTEYARPGVAIVSFAVLASLLIPYKSRLVESQIVTAVLAKGNSELFTRDLVMQAEQQFGSYSFFAAALAFFPERILFVCLYILWLWSWMAYGSMFFWMHKKHFHSRNAVFGAVVVLVAMGLTNYWDRWGAIVLGDNDLIYPFMRHQTLALVLGFAGLYMCWQRRAGIAGVLIGLALNFHVNTGQHCLIVLALGWLLLDRQAVRGYAQTVAVAGVVSLPTLWPLLHMSGASAANIHNPFIVVSGHFRHPHHLIPSSWSSELYLRYAVLIFSGLTAWWLKENKDKLDYHLLLLLLCPAAFVFAGFLFVEVIPIDFVAKLQFSRMTLFSKVVAFLYLSHLITRVPIPFEVRNWARVRRLGVTLVPAFLIGVLALGRHVVTAPVPNALEDFFRKHTAKSSLVLLPLDFKLAQFAIHSRRSVVVDLKRLPLGADANLVEYFRRVCAIEGVNPEFTPEMAQTMMSKREQNYHQLRSYQIENLHKIYQFDYMVRSAKYPPLLGTIPIFSGNGYQVYDFRSANSAS